MTYPTVVCWLRWQKWQWPRGSAPTSTAAPLAAHAFWFGEDQARYVVTVAADAAAAVMARAKTAGIPLRQLGITGTDALTLAGERPILVAKLRESFEGWLPAYMAGGSS